MRRSLPRWLAALVVIVLMRWLVAEPYLLTGRSMHPTFRDNDYIVIEKWSRRLADPRRGDVVLFREPHTGLKGLKRILGLPGETVRVRDDRVVVTRGPDVVCTVPISAQQRVSEDVLFPEVTLGEGELFVVGDHLGASIDSRSFGAITSDAVIGRELLRIYPNPRFRAAAAGAPICRRERTSAGANVPSEAGSRVGAIREKRPGSDRRFEMVG